MSDVYNVRASPPPDEVIASFWNDDMRDTPETEDGPDHVPFWQYGDPRYVN